MPLLPTFSHAGLFAGRASGVGADVLSFVAGGTTTSATAGRAGQAISAASRAQQVQILSVFMPAASEVVEPSAIIVDAARLARGLNCVAGAGGLC